MTRVLYIYYGTLGLAGGYIDGIVHAAADVPDLELHAAVSAYYRFPPRRSRLLKVFYPMTESTPENAFPHARLPRLPRLALRYLELCTAYVFLVGYVLVRRIHVVNMSLTDDYVVTLRFLDVLRWLGVMVHVTAHDSTPHGKVVPGRRAHAYRHAHRIVVHYPHVARDVAEGFDVPPAKIDQLPYPSADVTAVLDRARYAEALDAARGLVRDARRVVLFIGVLRTEKGLGDMLEGWARRQGAGEVLVVAGKPVTSAPPPGADRPDVVYVPRYLSSEEFQAWLEVSDVVALPYAIRNYAHSAVLLMAWLARRSVVASDIPLFANLVDTRTGWVFRAGDTAHLAEVLEAIGRAPAEQLRQQGEAGRQAVLDSWRDLPAALSRLYAPRGPAAGPEPGGGI
jgi:glycosyltransferase involved in cell wall biosynthesis